MLHTPRPRWARFQRLLRRDSDLRAPMDLATTTSQGVLRGLVGWPLLILVVGLGVSTWLSHRTQVLAQADQRSELQARLAGWRERVQGQLNTYLFQVEALGNVAQLDHGLTQDRFDDLSMRTISQVPSIRSVSYAVDDVVQYIHPLAGNESVLGLNLRSQPESYRQIEQARRMGLPLVLGPTSLVQGGKGLLIRRPIWLGPANQSGSGRDIPRAAVSLAVNLSDFLGQAGMFPMSDVRVRLRDTEPGAGDLWTSHAGIWPQEPVQATVHVPGRSWLLEALPAEGWRSTEAWHHPMFWVGGLLSLVISLLLSKQLHNQRLLQASHTQLLAQSQARARDLDRLAEQQRILRQLGTEAQTTRDRLQALLDAATEVAIIGTDLQGAILVFNTGAQRLLGQSQEQALGRLISDLFEPGSLRDMKAHAPRRGRTSDLMPLDEAHDGSRTDWQRLTARVLSRPSMPVSWIWRSASRDPVELSLTLGLVRDVLGQRAGFVLVARDVTPQLQAEAALNALNHALEQRVQERSEALEQAMRGMHAMRDDLINADKWSALGSVVAGVAHDLNTPIGNGLTAASSLEERFKQFEEAFEGGQLKRSALQQFLKEGGDLAGLITRSMRASADLLSHFKQASVDQTHNQARDFELHEIVSDILSILQPRLKRLPQRVTASVPEGITMFSHPGALGQVLMNLVNNAIDHGYETWAEQGRDLSEGEIRVYVSFSDNEEVVLCVEDNGQGMDPALQAKVFEPFFTTRRGRGGTGLGLSIVSGLVQSTLGGHLLLSTAAGEGCHFELRLPRYCDTGFSPVRIEGGATV